MNKNMRIKTNEKRMNTNERIRCLLLSIVYLFLLTSTVVHGQTTQTLTVSPPTQNFKAKPGKQVNANVKVRNESDDAVTLKAAFKDFLVLDDIGTPRMVEEEVSGRWSLSSWIVVSPTEVTVQAHSSKIFDLVILVPQDALPGGHYASVYFSPIGGALAPGQSGTGVETKLASLITLIVEGPVTEMAYIRKFFAPRFFEYGPVTITTQIENQSDLDITPKGTISVKNLLGKTVANFKMEERRIFPYAIRSFSNSIDKKWLLGRYQATLNAAYGTSGQALVAYLTFWVIPWRIITAIILGLAILVLIGYWLSQRRAKKEETEIPET